LNVVNGFSAGEIDAVEPGSAGKEIRVRVVEARQYRSAARIDHRRLRTPQTHDLAFAADAQDLIAADRDRFSHRALRVGGVDLGVVDDDVDRAVTIVALGSDDESGNQRCRDDTDDDVGGKAGGHETLRERRRKPCALTADSISKSGISGLRCDGLR
jgi:hypothetical protein